MLKKRIITSLWYAPLLGAVVWFGSEAGFTALIVILGVLAAIEFYSMVAASKSQPLTYFGLIWTALFILSRSTELLSLLKPHVNVDLQSILLTSAVVLSLIGLLGRRQKGGVFISWAWTLAGILYVGWLLSHFVALRGLDDGRNWVFFVLFVTWASDTAAFFIGRALGKHKLAPNISPGKTWEGAMGGICGAIIVSILFFTTTPVHLPIVYWQATILSVLVSVFGQLGDLLESLLKRRMGVKDSGRLMPGHGGVLDRIDSIVFASVVVYYYVIWVII